MRRWLGRLGLVLVAVLLVLGAASWTHLAAFPTLLPAFTAKEYCSCRFVMGRDDAYCHAYVAQWLPVSELNIDEPERQVTARGTGATRTARWLSPREGCRLD